MINKKALIDFLLMSLLIAFSLSGWVAYIYSQIDSDKEETRLLTEETSAILDSIQSSQPPRQTEHNSHPEVNKTYIPDEKTVEVLISDINKIINENKDLRDSLYYYKKFYQMINEIYDVEYKVTRKDSADYRIYFPSMTARGFKENKIKRQDVITDSTSQNNDCLDSIR